MKYKFIITFLITWTSYSFSYSQDILVMKSGDEIKVKVVEVFPDLVKYKKWDNQDGPSYSEYKSKIFMIKYQNGTKEVFNDQSSSGQTYERKSEPAAVDKKAYFEGKWIADAKSQVRYDGNRITEIIITRNGNNFIFEFNRNDLGLKTMGSPDQSNNISLYGGQWSVSLDATNNDNLFLKGSLFHRVGLSKNNVTNNAQQVNNISAKSEMNKPVDYKSYTGYLTFNNTGIIIKIENISVDDGEGNVSEAQKKVLEILTNMVRLEKGNLSNFSSSDTLNMIVSINFTYRNRSTSTGINYFSDCVIVIALKNITSTITYKNIYALTNYGLLARGFATKLDANRSLIANNFSQPLYQFIIGNFPITGEIIEVTEKNKKQDEAKMVKINLGSKDGLFDGCSFAVTDLGSSSTKADIIVKEIFDNYAICKVRDNEKRILESIGEGKKLKIKTIYKPE